MPNTFAGLGSTGIGDNFAKARLLLAQRAGYLPRTSRFDVSPQGASMQWHSLSKNLAGDSKQAGYPNPMAFLRAGLMAGGKMPRPPGHSNLQPQAPGLVNFNSSLAQQHTPMTPFQMQLPRLPGVRF